MKPERKGSAAHVSSKVSPLERRLPILDVRRAEGAESGKPGAKPQERAPKMLSATCGGEEARPEDCHRLKDSLLLDNLQRSWGPHWASGLPWSLHPERPFSGAEPILIPGEAAGRGCSSPSRELFTASLLPSAVCGPVLPLGLETIDTYLSACGALPQAFLSSRLWRS